MTVTVRTPLQALFGRFCLMRLGLLLLGGKEHILTMEERGISILTIEERSLLSWKQRSHLQSKSFATSSLPLGDRASLRGKQKEGGQSTQELEIKRFESYFVLQGAGDTRLQKSCKNGTRRADRAHKSWIFFVKVILVQNMFSMKMISLRQGHGTRAGEQDILINEITRKMEIRQLNDSALMQILPPQQGCKYRGIAEDKLVGSQGFIVPQVYRHYPATQFYLASVAARHVLVCERERASFLLGNCSLARTQIHMIGIRAVRKSGCIVCHLHTSLCTDLAGSSTCKLSKCTLALVGIK